MSDLQLSLIVIGLLVVAGVYLFNRLQERGYRRRMEHAFEREQKEDVLLTPTAPEPVAPEAPVAARIEPSLADAPDDAAPQAPPVTEAFSVSRAEALPVAEARGRTVLREPTLAAAPETPFIDYCAQLIGDGPLSGTVLAELAKQIAGIGKRTRLEVRDAPDALWQGLPDGGGDIVGAVRLAVQLADRTGPLSEAQLARFRELVQTAAAKLGATATFDDEADALDVAAVLDAFCADNDVAIGLNIVPRGVTGLVGTKLRALAEASGFALAADGSFHLHDDRGTTTILLTSMDGVPFEASSLKTLRSQGVSLVLDVPRVGEGRQVFRRMTELARNFAASLDGIVVDDRRAPLNDANLERIAAQIDPIQGALKARGITPGGALALRLFS